MEKGEARGAGSIQRQVRSKHGVLSALTVTLTQPGVTSVSLNEELPRPDWSVSMSVEGCLDS